MLVTLSVVYLALRLNCPLKSRHIFSTVPQKVDSSLDTVHLKKVGTLFLFMFGELTATSYSKLVRFMLQSSAETGFVCPFVGHFVKLGTNVTASPDEFDWIFVIKLV